MPRQAKYEIRWDATTAIYRAADELFAINDEVWGTWVARRQSFAFHGKQGHINLLHERRRSGKEGYWYAYRRQGTRIEKRYAGRTAQLTLARLEELAHALHHSPLPATPQPEQDVGARPAPVIPTLPLLTAKFQPPRLRTGLVQRERLLACLDAGRECALMIVSAPAGYGKTTVINQWITTRFAAGVLPAFAWLALDAGDTDPVRFWRYLIAACQRFHSAVGQEALALLHAATLPPFLPLSQDALLTIVLNDLERYHCQGVLVLEDYHFITTAQLHDALVFFFEHLPVGLHVVLMTRSDPPFPLASWRAQGIVAELFVPDLCFTHEEIAAFFQSASVLTPNAEDLAQIEARLEGWVAGLRMLAIALQGSTSHEWLHEWLGGAHITQRAFEEYFLAEVLETQPEAIQRFLLLTSGLQRLAGDLCDVVVERTDSGGLLDTLERAGLFLESPQPNNMWYRYHALFAEAMQREAQRRLGDEALRDASRRASAWYAAHAMLPEAIEAAFRGEDFLRAAQLIETYVGPELFILGMNSFNSMQEFYTLRHWLEHLPKDLLQGRPLLCMIFAATALMHIQVQQPGYETLMQIERVLRDAEDGWRRKGDMMRLGEVFAFRALTARERGAIREAVTWADQALSWLPVTSAAWRGVMMNVRGAGAWHDDQLEVARQLFVGARALSATLGTRTHARANTIMLLSLLWETGELRRAEQQFRAVLAEAYADDDRDDIGRINRELAQILYEWNDLDAAWLANAETLKTSRLLDDEEVQCYGIILHARLLHARGETSQALQALARMETGLAPSITPLRARLVRELRACQARLHFDRGDYLAVQAWWDVRESHQDDLPRHRLMQENALYVRLLLAQGQAEEALAILTDLRDAALRAGRAQFLIELQALSVLAQLTAWDHAGARQNMRALLAQARPEGYIRVFLECGSALEGLIRALLHDLRDPALRLYARRILHDFARERGEAESATTATDVLSPQELRVLRLLVAGQTNPEIARELVVSLNTVKAHIKNLYRKLGVNGRVTATLAARQQHLL